MATRLQTTRNLPMATRESNPFETRSYDDLKRAQEELHGARGRLFALLPHMGKANADIEYNSENKLNALADAVKVIRAADPEIAQGAAESAARTLDSYREVIRNLYEKFAKAKLAEKEWALNMEDIDIGRTDVSTEKALAELQ